VLFVERLEDFGFQEIPGVAHKKSLQAIRETIDDLIIEHTSRRKEDLFKVRLFITYAMEFESM
jgi:hypothetical protein